MLSVTVLLANPRRRAPDHQPPGFRPIARRAADSAPRPPGRRRNPGLLAKAPTPDDEEIEPYDVAEIKQLLEAAAKRRNSARWAAALALGLRQGEALGLKREDVDLDGGVLRIRCSRLRPKYRHGCGGTCGQPTAGPCPKRLQTNNATKKTKSRAGRRTIGLPPPLIALLRKHLADQDAEREKARQLWSDEGWLFTTATGAPINPSTDYHEWKRLLKVAGLREARLHDARHTAATVLLILGQPERTVMSLMGWSSTNMTQRYQHVTDVVRAEVASQIGGLIWEARSDGSGEQTVLVRRDSLATILPYVEQGLLEKNGGDVDLGELEAALTDLRTAMTKPDDETQGGSE